MSQQTVQIGNKIYDAKTGALLKIVQPQIDITKSPTRPHAPLHVKHKTEIHKPRKATTLNRDFVKAPVITPKAKPPLIRKRATRTITETLQPRPALRTSSFQSRQIKHFMTAQQAQALNSKKPVVLNQIINPDVVVSHQANYHLKQTVAQARQTDFFTRHRMQQIAKQRRQQELAALKQTEQAFAGNRPALPSLSAQQARAINAQVKQQTLAAAIANDNPQRTTGVSKPSFIKQHLSLIAASLAVIILGGYLTYLNLPNISLRIAASRAGINASYPEYQPKGYSLKKLANFENDQVVIEYQNNDKLLKLSQQASQWDSKTVLENLVKKQAGEVYQTNQTKGLTIYIYNNQATWINGGILYNLSINDSISTDQIHKIATSL